MIEWCRKYNNQIKHWKSYFEHFVFDPLYARKAGNNYGLLKVHKSKNNKLDEMPMRVITSIEQTPLYPLCYFIQHHLQPIAKTLTHCIPDVFGLLRFICKFNLLQLNSVNPIKLSNYKMLLLDVVNMFPSIDTTKGIKINGDYMRSFYEEYPEFIKRFNFPTVDCVIDALNIALRNNISKFGKDFRIPWKFQVIRCVFRI